MRQKDPSDLMEELLHLRRVSRKTPGGNYATYSVLMGVGDGKGQFGIGMARATEVPIAISKATRQAKKNMIPVHMKGTTIPRDMDIKYKAAKILLKPAPPGTGLKAGSVLRQIMILAGIRDISAKLYGSGNKINVSYAVYHAFQSLHEQS